MKEFEGKTVYLRPTGNNAKGNNNRILIARIIKVARVNVILSFGDNKLEHKYRYKDNHLSDLHNGGYDVYAIEQEVLDYYESIRISKKIVNSYSYSYQFKSLPLDKLKKVAELLDIDISDI